jgi:phage replication O-like protein O
MNAPDYDHGYLRVPLAVWREVYCQAPLTRRELQLVSVVIRESWGWQKRGGQVNLWTRPFTPSQLARLTNLSTDHLSRDLRSLVRRGVLRERERCYQFVPDPRLWKSPPAGAPKRRQPALEPPVGAAETALLPPDVKTAKKEQRNDRRQQETPFSPIGDNSPMLAPSMPGRPGRTRWLLPEGGPSGFSDRLAQLIEAFVGPLPISEATALREWIQNAGVVPVWDTLEPAFRQGRRATREHLQERLTPWIGCPGEEERA